MEDGQGQDSTMSSGSEDEELRLSDSSSNGSDNGSNYSSEEFSSDEDSSSSSSSNSSSKNSGRSRGSATKRKKANDHEEETAKLSKYEQIRLKNIQERAALLASLGLQELKEKMFHRNKRREKTEEEGSPLSCKLPNCSENGLTECLSMQNADASISDCSPESNRFNGRMLTRRKQKIEVSTISDDTFSSIGESQPHTKIEVSNISDDTFSSIGESQPHTKIEVSNISDDTFSSIGESQPHTVVPNTMLMADCYYEEEQDFQLCLAQLRSLQYDFKAPFRPLNSRWLTQLSSMKLEERYTAKVVDYPISSIAIHPSSTCVMACAGDADGNIAIWDVAAGECVDGIHRFAMHSDAINCLEFAPCHPEQLYGASSDGAIKCTNLQKASFDLIWEAEDDQSINYFDFMPPSSLCIAQSRGLLSIVDIRSPLSEHIFRLCLDNIKTVNVHPFRKEYILTACDGGEINVWDLRFMTTLVQPCTRLPLTKSASSAFFSPVTGNSIVASSKDCYQRLFDSSSLVLHLPLTACRKFYRAPAPTYFRPSWVPGRDDCFVVSSSQYPCRIELVSFKGKDLHSFYLDPALKAPTCLTRFHPTQNILLGGSRNGSLCVIR